MSRSSETIPAPLSIRTGGRISSTLRPQCALKPAFSAASATSRDGGLGLLLVGHVAPVQRRDRLLVLEPHAQLAQRLGVVLAGEVLHPPRPGLELAVHLRRDRARAQDLRPVRAEVGDRAERHDAARVGRPAARHARHDAVALGDLDQRPPRRLGHVRVVGMLDDRREHAVDVEQHGGALRVVLEGPEELVEGAVGAGTAPSMQT